MPRRFVAFAIALMLLVFSSDAMAAGGRKGDLSLTAVVGGALPYSTDGGGYLVTRLISPDQNARIIDFAAQAPFGRDMGKVFDARPQFGLGGRYELGKTPGGLKLTLRAMVSTAMERPSEGERPLLGVAGLTVLF
ncbi:hypothetical protein [Pseudoroseomonas ludipueritiae]|uniref:MipA/OmpV family protein n=1 Tax=Pseudoroseomonas ludipueritiae TaxID=198093 RepID=A0ABR7R3T8_9PROT|nr:hypothetical protein [Pseudoroseomonas ludipueritiae]MBC9176338.1 hypothetical protein [Pseudoroseomonas ludipueritiae]